MGKAELELAKLRQQTIARFALIDAQLPMMREHFERRLEIIQIELQVHAQKEATAAALAQLCSKIDKSTHWTIGLLISGLIGMIALAARGLL